MLNEQSKRTVDRGNTSAGFGGGVVLKRLGSVAEKDSKQAILNEEVEQTKPTNLCLMCMYLIDQLNPFYSVKQAILEASRVPPRGPMIQELIYALV